MVHQSLKQLLFEALDRNQPLSKLQKSKLKAEINSLPDCVSFIVLREIVEDYTGKLPLEGKGNDPKYHNMQMCGNQQYCDALRKLNRCNPEQCFFSTHYG